LTRILGDFDLAEEIVQDAIVVALERWPRDGMPDEPAAWLFTVAKRRALNRLRRAADYRHKLLLLAKTESVPAADDRLRLMFVCCHPALAREAQVALTLRTICGLTTAQVARALLVSEATVAQRIVRAKRKIVKAGIAYQVPRAEDLPNRLNEVLAVLYLVFNEGYLASEAQQPARRDLADDALWLTQLLCTLLPTEAEPLGLLALMKLHMARLAARFDRWGNLVLLRDQDRSLWDRSLIEEGVALIFRAGAMKRPGPYQVEAAIAACHAEAPTFEATDWQQVVMLYDVLLRMAPSPVTRLNRAIALRPVAGAEAALTEVERLAADLNEYHLFHAARAELLSELGDREGAAAANQRALALTVNPGEQQLLRRRLLELASASS
jgi:RNA polymerase sigma-70 factor (ECF subfamily)